MSTFSSFVDSVFLPNNSSINNNNNNMCEEPNNNAQIYQNLDQSTIVVSAHSNNEAPSDLSITNKNTIDSSSIITHSSNDQMTQKNTPMNRKRKCIVGSFANSAQSKDMREVKGKKKKEMKDGEEKNMPKQEKKCEKLAILEEAPKGYIHVRARRGQATDSHSLAEKVRREKISDRMKLLQSIVPGCDKVIGKALMLDIIINYVQSLQNQVEFLSLKLASVNPMSYDFGLDIPFMIGPDQNLPSSLPTMHEISPTTANNYTLLDNSVNSLLFHQSQIPSDMPQGRQVLWEMEDQRQKIINQSGFSNNLFLLH